MILLASRSGKIHPPLVYLLSSLCFAVITHSGNFLFFILFSHLHMCMCCPAEPNRAARPCPSEHPPHLFVPHPLFGTAPCWPPHLPASRPAPHAAGVLYPAAQPQWKVTKILKPQTLRFSAIINCCLLFLWSHSVPGLEADAFEGNFLSAEDGEECSALSDSLSRLRSPSMMEVREKGYDRLKDELAKAQRVKHTQTHRVEA